MNQIVQPECIVCPTKLLHPQAKAPTRAEDGSAGYDIYCVGGFAGLDLDSSVATPENRKVWEYMQCNGSYTLQPGCGALFRTGMAQAIPHEFVGLLFDRSSMGAVKCVGRLAGVIDSSYRGEWIVRLINFGQSPVRIAPGDKIVQCLYQRRFSAECPIVDELPASNRGKNGFGSSDS